MAYSLLRDIYNWYVNIVYSETFIIGMAYSDTLMIGMSYSLLRDTYNWYGL